MYAFTLYSYSSSEPWGSLFCEVTNMPDVPCTWSLPIPTEWIQICQSEPIFKALITLINGLRGGSGCSNQYCEFIIWLGCHCYERIYQVPRTRPLTLPPTLLTTTYRIWLCPLEWTWIAIRGATSILTRLLSSCYWGYDQPHADLLFEVMWNVYYF